MRVRSNVTMWVVVACAVELVSLLQQCEVRVCVCVCVDVRVMECSLEFRMTYSVRTHSDFILRKVSSAVVG